MSVASREVAPPELPPLEVTEEPLEETTMLPVEGKQVIHIKLYHSFCPSVCTHARRWKDEARKELSDVSGALSPFLACLNLQRHGVVTQIVCLKFEYETIDSDWFRPLI